MAVKPTSHQILRDEEGQSILELLLLLPALLGMTVMLIHANTAIQVSIVNQQYARAQALWLTFNSSVYPSLAQRVANFDAKGYNQMVIGVSDNRAPNSADEKYNPKATVQNVGRKPASGGSDQPQTEPL